jgi:AraC-like DNA-binding protein
MLNANYILFFSFFLVFWCRVKTVVGTMQDVPSAAPVITLRFEGEPDSKPFHAWREELARECLDMDYEPLGTGLFRAAVRLNPLPGLHICDATGTPQRHYSRLETSRRSGRFGVLLSRGTRFRHEQGRKSTELGDGDVLLGDLSRPWQLDMAPFRRVTGLVVEREVVLALVPNAEDLACRHIPVSPAMVSLFAATLDLATPLGADLDPLARKAVSRHLVDLIALVLGAKGDTAELARGRGLAAAQLMVIKRYVVDQLSEPNVSVREVAARHSVSVRYVQLLFERSGTTFTKFLMEQRLLAAYDRLTNVLTRAASVAQIASECGFGDLSTFNRAFRRRFAATPSDIRAEALLRSVVMF